MVLNVVAHALKMTLAQTANKKWRLKMKNKKNKSQKTMKAEFKLSPKQTTQGLNSQAERNEKRRLALRFSPTAWAKLLYFRDKSDNEVGGFGITEPD